MQTMTALDAKHLAKEAGYDQWLQTKIDLTRANLKSKTSAVHDHDDVMDRVWNRLQVKAELDAVTA